MSDRIRMCFFFPIRLSAIKRDRFFLIAHHHSRFTTSQISLNHR